MKTFIQRNTTFFMFSFALLMLVVAVFLFRNSRYLFLSHDGQFFLYSFINYSTWSTGPFVGSHNPLQSATGLFSFDGHLIPCVYPFMLDIPLRMKAILCYLVLAAEMYLAVYFLLRSIGSNVLTSTTLGWFTVLTLFPTFLMIGSMRFIFLISPLRAHGMALSLVAMAALLNVNVIFNSRSVLYSILFITTTTIIANTSYMVAASMLPMLSLGIILIIFAGRDNHERLSRLTTTLAAILFIFGSGAAHSILGQICASARFTLTGEFIDAAPSLMFTSVLMNMNDPMLLLIPLSAIGSVLLMLHANRTLRFCGIYCSLLMLSVLTMSLLYYFNILDFRGTLRPAYVEYSFYALYPLVGAYAFARIVSRFTKEIPETFIPRIRLYAIILACAYFTLYFTNTALRFNFFESKTLPHIAETVLIQRLKAEIAITPGSTFRGRCVSFLWTGAYTDEEIASGNLPKFNASPANSYTALKNTHLQSNLWAFNIPTIEGYDQATTLPFYLTFSRACSAAPWVVNHTCISRFNIPLLRASGVRFIITPRQVKVQGLTLAAYILYSNNSVLAQEGSQPGEYPHPPEGETTGHFLYEIQGTNLGTYSPQTITRIDNISQALDRISDNDFDYTNELLVFATGIPQSGYVGINSSQVTFRRGGIRLNASSSGVSAILLPFQYSKSARWEPDKGTKPPLHIIRADMFMTCVIFDKEVSGTLWLDTGFGLSRASRLEDYWDMRKLKVLDIPRRNLTGEDKWLQE